MRDRALRAERGARDARILASDTGRSRGAFERAAAALLEAEIAACDECDARMFAAEAFATMRELGWRPLAARAAELAGDERIAIRLYRECGFVAEMRRIEERSRKRGDSRPTALLTLRERQVSDLIAAGATNRATAATMDISEKTVEKHLASVYKKLAITSRAELRAYVARATATDDEPTAGLEPATL